MAQDYAKKSATRYPKQKAAEPKSSRPAFASGLIIGALCMYFIPILLEPNPTDSKTLVKSAETSKLSALKFDFYTLLKDSEIIVPESGQFENSKSQVEEKYSYVLQAGSFRNPRDAENLKVQLLLLNLSAEIETFSLDTGTVHRILVGPFANTSKMASARAKLAENKINSLVLKRKL
jgi:cell division protein FtsN